MRENPTSSERLKSILVLVATIGMIAFNGLSAAGYINGVTPEMISGKYPTVVTPAGYAFTIWSLIYLGMLAFSIYQILPSNAYRFSNIRSVYILSCVLNCGWIFFWHRDQIGFCLALILALVATLIFIISRLKTVDSFGEEWLVKAPFGIYAGWVTAASIVNFVIFLSYIDVNMSASSASIFGALLILFAAALGIIVRWRLKNYFYPLAIAWALTAIAVKQSGNTPIVVAAAIGVVVSMVTAFSFVVDLPSSRIE